MDTKIYNFHQLKGAKGFKIVRINIRSLPKKIDQLRVILESSNIDIFTISETWLHNKIDSQLIQIPGYETIRLDRVSNSHKKRGGGLNIYARKTLNTKILKLENSSKDLEIQWIKIVRDHAKNILLANIYRPPTGNLNQAISTLEKGITSFNKSNEEIVILGDFNVDYKNKKSPNFKKSSLRKQTPLTN